MDVRDFFEDDEMNILKPEFRRERKHELMKWINDHRTGNAISSAEFKKRMLEEKGKLRAQKSTNPKPPGL